MKDTRAVLTLFHLHHLLHLPFFTPNPSQHRLIASQAHIILSSGALRAMIWVLPHIQECRANRSRRYRRARAPKTNLGISTKSRMIPFCNPTLKALLDMEQECSTVQCSFWKHNRQRYLFGSFMSHYSKYSPSSRLHAYAMAAE